MTAAKPCPQCHQNAPIVLRGVDAFCTVCNAARTPFAANILNVAGKPARIGGYAARVFGWGALIVGLFLALTLGLVVQAVAALFVATTWIGWAVGVPIALLSVIVALFGIIGGKKLGQSGEGSLRKAQHETIHGLARHQRGIVRPAEAARALGIDEAAADTLLATLAKDPRENVAIDLDPEGKVFYLFGSAEAIRWRIQAERAGITDADREALEEELQRADGFHADDPDRARTGRR
jgi:hypothetical protein